MVCCIVYRYKISLNCSRKVTKSLALEPNHFSFDLTYQ